MLKTKKFTKTDMGSWLLIEVPKVDRRPLAAKNKSEYAIPNVTIHHHVKISRFLFLKVRGESLKVFWKLKMNPSF